MGSPAYDLCYYIRNTIGKGTALAADLFANSMPDSPANCISVFQYGGDLSNKGFGGDTAPLENFALQVNVRNTNPETAESTCYDIYKALDQMSANITINSTTYTWFHPLQPPFLLERDESNRAIYIFNLECQRVRPS